MRITQEYIRELTAIKKLAREVVSRYCAINGNPKLAPIIDIMAREAKERGLNVSLTLMFVSGYLDGFSHGKQWGEAKSEKTNRLMGNLPKDWVSTPTDPLVDEFATIE